MGHPTSDHDPPPTRRALTFGGAAALTALIPATAAFGARPGYPRSYAALEARAAREGALLIYSSADLTDMAAILTSFRTRYPRLKVDYRHIPSSDLYSRYVREIGASVPSADFLFSSAMDSQIKLVNDGYAQPYPSPEKPYLPSWAVWKNEAYGVTAEPIVFAYNKRLLDAADIPYSHDELERLLTRKGPKWSGKVGTYDVERSATGFLFFTQDLQLSFDTWKLLRALGKTRPVLDIGAHEILSRVSNGEQILAYNVMSSYALERRANNPWVEVIFPRDYTLVMSRIAFISKEARHPAAAKLFLDFLLSRDGQTLMSRRYMTPVRTDMEIASPHANPRDLRAIHVGPALLANLDRLKHAKLIAEWRQAVAR